MPYGHSVTAQWPFVKYGHCRPLTPKPRPVKSGKILEFDFLILKIVIIGGLEGEVSQTFAALD